VRYKLFAVDLDGTLLDHSGRVHDEDLRAMKDIAAAGVKVSIVTGRLYSGTKAAALAIGAKTPVACVDGSHIVHAEDDRDLFHLPIAGAHAESLRAAVELHRPACFVFAHDEIVHDPEGAPYLPYVQTWSTKLVSHDRATSHAHWEHPRGLSEVVCIGEQSVIFATATEIEARLNGAAQVATFPLRQLQDRWGMVIRAAGASKGTAITWLSKHHGVSVEEAVVVGDWLNDLSMFAVAGRSFAMGQAPEMVKRAATDALDATSATGGGIAEAARRAGILR
jgi:Cof subfamily protein (haloacid dehalogenase superfamily)